MRYKQFIIGLLSVLAVSCSFHEWEVAETDSSDVFYASIENAGAPDTRVYATEDLYLRWHADDRVSIFNNSTDNREYRFMGATGDNAGSFTRVDGGDSGADGTLDGIYAVYPYLASTRIDAAGVITVTLPAEQSYAENTFAAGANTMVSSTTDNQLLFKNTGGYLLLKLYGDDVAVSSISLRGNQGECLAGEATVTMPVDGVPAVVMSETAGQEIRLVCDKPVQIGTSAETASVFWLVVPPTTFSEGFTVKVEDEKAYVFEKSTTKFFEISRNTIARMTALEVTPVAPPVSSVTLDRTSVTMKVGESLALQATVKPVDAPLTWTSSDNEIAVVYNGVVTALKSGNAIITVSTEDKSAQCTVNVSDTSTGIGDWEIGDNSNGSI